MSLVVVSDFVFSVEYADRVTKLLQPSNGKFINGLGDDPAQSQAEVMYVTQPKADVIRAMPHLRWLHIPFVGVNSLLAVQEVREGSQIVTNARGLIADSVADQVMAFVLSFSRCMPQLWEAQKRSEWAHEAVQPHADDLRNQTMGLIGYGEIGEAIGQRAKAFGMRTVATRTQPHKPANYLDQTLPTTALPELLAQSDYLVVTAPLTPETRGMLGAAEFAMMKPTAYLINIARGPLVRETELITALQNGHLAGAGLDVFEREPLVSDSPLWQMPNVLITPHTAGLFKQLFPSAQAFFCQNLERYLNNQPLENIIDKKRGY